MKLIHSYFVFLTYNTLIVNCLNNETILWKDILENGNYNRYVRRPNLNKSKPIEVKFEIVLNTIHELNMKDQILTTSVGMKISWSDEFLTWNSSLYEGINRISVPLSKIWNPDVNLINYTDNPNIFVDEKKRVNIDSDGLVEWQNDLILKTYCLVDTQRYPFETETCKLNFAAQHLQNEEQVFSIKMKNNFFKQYHSNGEWHISKPEHIKCYKSNRHWDDKTFAGVVLEIEMNRRQTYYVWRFFTPTIAITCINLVTFWLSVKSGAKITLSIFAILSFTVMIDLYNESLPSTSDKIAYFGMFLWVLLSISGATLISNVVITVRYYRKLNWIKRCCNKDKYVVEQLSNPLQKDEGNTDNAKAKGEVENEKAKENKKNKRKQTASICDFVCFVIFFILFAATYITFYQIIFGGKDNVA
ncbi:neuronal acetylcholine receptor subunit beta-4-like [Mytilus edulis]|uniref:neuronal acetylcholine receptor subunit beta-4-like n=1 Tax=Mytilus edulis TaxID=6550 RepID=UPI0039F0DDF7